MRVILDECVPRPLGRELVGHSVTTVVKAGWAGVVNGQLLKLIEGNFDAFITTDKSLPNQHSIASLSFGVVILRAASNDLDDLKPLVPQILATLATIKPRQLAIAAAPGF
jgi:hypothetical protein